MQEKPCFWSNDFLKLLIRSNVKKQLLLMGICLIICLWADALGRICFGSQACNQSNSFHLNPLFEVASFKQLVESLDQKYAQRLFLRVLKNITFRILLIMCIQIPIIRLVNHGRKTLSLMKWLPKVASQKQCEKAISTKGNLIDNVLESRRTCTKMLLVTRMQSIKFCSVEFSFSLCQAASLHLNPSCFS